MNKTFNIAWYQVNSDLWYPLEQQGHVVHKLNMQNPLEHIRDLAKQLDIDIFIIDRDFEFDGVKYPPFYLISQVRLFNRVTPIVACSYYRDKESFTAAYRNGATTYFIRPAQLYQLEPLIASIAYRRVVFGDFAINGALKVPFGNFIFDIETKIIKYKGDKPLSKRYVTLGTDGIELQNTPAYLLRYLLNCRNNIAYLDDICTALLQRYDNFTKNEIITAARTLNHIFNRDPSASVRLMMRPYGFVLYIAAEHLLSQESHEEMKRMRTAMERYRRKIESKEVREILERGKERAALFDQGKDI